MWIVGLWGSNLVSRPKPRTARHQDGPGDFHPPSLVSPLAPTHGKDSLVKPHPPYSQAFERKA